MKATERYLRKSLTIPKTPAAPIVKPPGVHPDIATANHLNNMTFYHGTGMPHLDHTMLDSNKTANNNWFGPGVYGTEHPGIADGYAKEAIDRGKLGAQIPTVYEMNTKFNKALDLHEPSPDHVRDVFRNVMAGRSDGNEHVLPMLHRILNEPKTTTFSLYDTMRSSYPFTETGHPFREVNRRLSADHGYDGLTHIGGGNTGNDAHRVVIALDPQERKNINKFEPQFQGGEAAAWPDLSKPGIAAQSLREKKNRALHEAARTFVPDSNTTLNDSGIGLHLDKIARRYDPHFTDSNDRTLRNDLGQKYLLHRWAKGEKNGKSQDENFERLTVGRPGAAMLQDQDIIGGFKRETDPEEKEKYYDNFDKYNYPHEWPKEHRKWLANRILDRAKKDKWFEYPEEDKK